MGKSTSNITSDEVYAVLHVIGGEAGMTITEIAEALGFEGRKDQAAVKEVYAIVQQLMLAEPPQVCRVDSAHREIHVRAVELAACEPTNTAEWRDQVDAKTCPYEIVRINPNDGSLYAGEPPRLVDLARNEQEMREKVAFYRRDWGTINGRRTGVLHFARKRSDAAARPTRPAIPAIAVTPATITDSTASRAGTTRESDE